MNVFAKAKYRIIKIEDEAKKNKLINRLHPLLKIIITLLFIIITTCVNKYDLNTLLYLILYPVILIIISDVPLKPIFKLVLLFSPFIVFSGIANILLDKKVFFYVDTFKITGGIISCITLIIKNIYSILATYILISTTGIYNICYALKLLHMPNIIVNQVLLTYRYIFVLLDEADEMYQAYSLRNPAKKGLDYRVWGSFIGSLFVRSSVRANELWDSMQLRGYDGSNLYFMKGKISNE